MHLDNFIGDRSYKENTCLPLEEQMITAVPDMSAGKFWKPAMEYGQSPILSVSPTFLIDLQVSYMHVQLNL